MPLKKTASAKPAPDNAIIQRSCPYCGQVHTLARGKLSPDAVTLICKSCNRPVPLRLEQPAGMVQPLKKEATQPATTNPAAQPSQPADILAITCPNCAKIYKVRREMIPPTARTLKCKACGHRMGLPLVNGLPLDQGVAASDAVPAVDRPGRKIRRYALAAGIILAVMAGAFTGYRFYSDQQRSQPAPLSAKPTAASAAVLQAGPFLTLDLNVPRILDNLERGVDKDQKTLEFRTTLALAKSLKLKHLELFLYAGSENQILPVVMTRGNTAGYLEKLITRREPFKKYFERESSGSFRLKKEALGQAGKHNIPANPIK